MLYVTPFAGVWIEITVIPSASVVSLSLPLRECGLKYHRFVHRLHLSAVTPFAGVWIEIPVRKDPDKKRSCHSLCGSVD